MRSDTLPAKLDILMAAARIAAARRGHSLGEFSRDETFAAAACLDCQCFVYVNTEPRPNEIGLGGTAVALNCSR